MKKAIITGGTGFIGSNLCKKLIKQNWEVYLISRKTSKYDNLKEIKDKITIFEYEGNLKKLINWFKKVKADVVFHLASVIIVEHKVEDIDNLIDTNLKFGTQILEAMKESQTLKIINTGTFWQHYNNEKYNPVCLYAATKEAFEKILKYYIEAENFRAITLKLFDTYGERDKRPKLINLLNKFANKQIELNMSPGEQIIDLVHVEDVANAFIKAYELLKKNTKINYKEYAVSSCRKIKLKELVEIYKNITGNKINVNWGGRPYRKREVMHPWHDFEILPNWNCKISLENGLKRYKKL
jgi:nucleoside-diphosphate-sugar epimerase